VDKFSVKTRYGTTENLAAFIHFAADADSFITLALPNRSDLMLNDEQIAKSVCQIRGKIVREAADILS